MNHSRFHPYDEIEDFFKRLFARSLRLDLDGKPAQPREDRSCESCAAPEVPSELSPPPQPPDQARGT